MVATARRRTRDIVPGAAFYDDLPLMAWQAGVDGLLNYFNPRVEEYSGMRGESLAGLGWVSLVHPDDRARVLHRWLQSIASGARYSNEFRIRKYNRSYGWFLVQAIRVAGRDPGQACRWVGTCTEVEHDTLRTVAPASPLQPLEQEEGLGLLQLLSRREEVARAGGVALLQQVAALLTHDLNQPLTAILSNTQALQAQLNKYAAVLDAELHETVSDLVQEERKAIEALREMRKPLLRHDPARTHCEDVNVLVREAVTLHQVELMAHGCALDLDLSTRPLRACIDRAQMTHVLTSLISNGCEAMSQLEPGSRRMRIRTSPGAAGVRIEVADVGPGMQGEAQRCFDPFYSTRPHRLGLGLAVCKAIVEAHGGEISCRDGVSGAVFRIDLPRVQPA